MDIRRVSKENKKLLRCVPTSPNPIKFSKRQLRLKRINKLKRSGFPKLHANFMIPVTFIKNGKVYRGRYGLKTKSISLEKK